MREVAVGLLDKLDMETAKKESAGIEFTKEEKARVDQHMFVMEISSLAYPPRGQQRPERADVVKSIYTSHKAGKRLPKGASMEAYVDDALVEAAMEHKDKDVFMFSADRVKKELKTRIEQSEENLVRYAKMVEDGGRNADRAKGAIDRTEQFISDTKKRLSEMEAFLKTIGG